MLSGKYNFHSMKNNKPAYISQGVGFKGIYHYLVWYDKCWYIQDGEWFFEGKPGGYFYISASGKYSYQFENSLDINVLSILYSRY